MSGKLLMLLLIFISWTSLGQNYFHLFAPPKELSEMRLDLNTGEYKISNESPGYGITVDVFEDNATFTKMGVTVFLSQKEILPQKSYADKNLLAILTRAYTDSSGKKYIISLCLDTFNRIWIATIYFGRDGYLLTGDGNPMTEK
jgi:hypothetical protein